MSKYFINGEEFANLATARKAAKELSKKYDGDVVINNEDTTVKAVYNSGKEVEVKEPNNIKEEAVVESAEPAVLTVAEDNEAVVVSTMPTEPVELPENVYYRVILRDKANGARSYLIDPPSVGGYFKTFYDAEQCVEKFMRLTRLGDKLDSEIVTEKASQKLF